MYMYMVPFGSPTNNFAEIEPTSDHWTVFTFDFPSICIIYYWNSGHFTTSENEWNRRNTTKLEFPSLCPLKSRGEDFKNGFQIFQFSWILLVPKHSLLKYFTLTFTRHKSSKFEGFRSTLKNPFAIGRNSARYSYHTNLSDSSLLCRVPTALHISQSVKYAPDSRMSPNWSNSKKFRKRANLTEKSRCSSKEPWKSQKSFDEDLGRIESRKNRSKQPFSFFNRQSFNTPTDQPTRRCHTSETPFNCACVCVRACSVSKMWSTQSIRHKNKMRPSLSAEHSSAATTSTCFLSAIVFCKYTRLSYSTIKST